MLDIVRAARQLDPSIGKRFLIAGHSQGGQSALFAAGEAGSYVPDLSLRGTVAYAPASHLKEQAQALPALTSPSAPDGARGHDRAGRTTVTPSPPIDPNALLSDQVLAYYPLIDKLCLSICLDQPARRHRAFDHAAPGADMTALFKVLAKQNPAYRPRRRWSSLRARPTQTVFKAFTDTLVNELNGAGDNVTYDVFPGVDHGGIVGASEAEGARFFKSKLPPH